MKFWFQLLSFVFVVGLSKLGVASELSDKANELAAGQAIRLNTSISDSIWWPSGGGGANAISIYSNKGVWDSVHDQAKFMGKRASGPVPYFLVVYDAASNTWSHGSHPVPPGFGHGYDHNAINPVTGDYYFRVYASKTIHQWTASTSKWSIVSPTWEGGGLCCDGLEWVPGKGLFFSHGITPQYFNGSGWITVEGTSEFGYNDIAVYEADGRVLVFGQGSSGSLYKWTGTGKATALNHNCGFRIGTSPDGGSIVGDPGSGSDFIVYHKENGSWHVLNPSTGNCSSMPERTLSDPYVAANGAPPLGLSNDGVISIPIPEHGVTMYIEPLAGGKTEAWLYRHSPFTGDATPPSPPSSLEVQ